MKVTHLNGACEIIESYGVKILTDPWLVDGEYYGSWYMYPPLTNFDFDSLNDVDYIYISHIHPDHLSKLTLEKLNTNIPVLIHKFPTPFLKSNIERLGFTVIELESNVRTHLKNDVYINIIPAGYCNPVHCSKTFGCGKIETNFASTIVDTLCVIDDNEYVLLNVNDCPYPVAKFAIDNILKSYNKIDFLITGYTGASAYPQCFSNYSNEEKLLKAAQQKQYYFDSGLSFITHCKPEHFMLHAGTYILAGPLVELEPYRAINDIKDTNDAYNTLQTTSNGILLNSYESFDLVTKQQSNPYMHFTEQNRTSYINDILIHKTYSFEDDVPTDVYELTKLCIDSYKRFENKRKELNLHNDTIIYIELDNVNFAKISFNGNGIEFVKSIDKSTPYLLLSVPTKLLKRILLGPKYAHWNNAEIGSFITYYRSPDVYNREIYYCLNYFHI
jgi:UDP-MurNAc hydroxylase